MHAFDYAVVRIVPRVERGEFVNAGVILFSRTARFLDARIALDAARLSALAPSLDRDVVQSYLDSIPRICAGGPDAGPIGLLVAERALSLARRSAQHDHSNLAGAFGSERRSGGGAGAFV